MPSKTHWGLNPKKWFSSMSSSSQNRDKTGHGSLQTLPAAITITRTISVSSNIAHLVKPKSKTKVTPMTHSSNVNKTHVTIVTPITQLLQLPAFSIRRERTSTLLPSMSFGRQNAFLPVHTEPTIRRNGRCEDNLGINTKRSSIQPSSTLIAVVPKDETIQQTGPMQLMEMSVMNMSHRCLIDYPRHSPDPIVESPSPTRSSSTSSLIDDTHSNNNNNNNHSSTSGIGADDVIDDSQSRDLLSTMRVLSVESIADSETSFDHSHARPVIHHYRRPISVIEFDDYQSPQPERPISTMSSARSGSPEDMFEDSQTFSVANNRPQSSATIDKNLEKRIRSIPSPVDALENTEIAAIDYTTYYSTLDEVDERSTSSRNSMNSFVPDMNCDESLRPAYDEECYAALPCGSSTEQINNNLQNDLRIIVDGYIRPMATSIDTNHLTKTHQHRSKRASVQHDNTQLIIEDITDKLLSSIDYPIYTQHQRCY